MAKAGPKLPLDELITAAKHMPSGRLHNAADVADNVPLLNHRPPITFRHPSGSSLDEGSVISSIEFCDNKSGTEAKPSIAKSNFTKSTELMTHPPAEPKV